ncbi:hypothetical protein Bcoa_1568 [Heyndrickxia coagulans 36D1]|jgi:hypothetical protein|uniref:Uncharacterized protein n=1 Tax=Heyndrickxia coagulans 36D1 TaxID=345219 RepID=G2TJ08_HEYCO|nr:hypothetical protein Bcoa_1568 [Heyndrickxia coagulans 36D1]
MDDLAGCFTAVRPHGLSVGFLPVLHEIHFAIRSGKQRDLKLEIYNIRLEIPPPHAIHLLF